jgi:hypothetical protein
MRSSTKIAIGFAALILVGYFGFQKVTDLMIMGQEFPPIVPGKINIIGVNTGAGYRVIVSNELAQLVETQGGFQQGNIDDPSTDSAVKKRIPLREMLETLQGDSKALGSFVMTMNDLSENDLPPVRVIWTKPDLEKAFQGDKKLQAKLENDLNMKLDGTPLPTLRISSLENGIVLSVPVTVNVNLQKGPTPVTGQVLEAYQPKMLKAVQADYAQDPRSTDTVKAGYYAQEAQEVMTKGSKENIKASIEEKMSDSEVQSLIETPKRILDSAFIVLNDGFIDEAKYNTYTSNDGKSMHDLTIDLNDEGRRRLWKYSKKRVGDQLLLVSDGIAIAAPRIQHPLMGGEITITKMPDQTILDDFIDKYNETKGKTKTASR